jgi:hypothetical protein
MRNWHGNLSPFGQWHTGGRASFSPAALFAFGEQGAWFDPSDVANLNWRVNLLVSSRDPFVVIAGVVTKADAGINAPTGDQYVRIIELSGTGSGKRFFNQSLPTVAGDNTFSFYAKENTGGRWINFRENTTTGFAFSFQPSTGSVTGYAGGASSSNVFVQTVATGVYRVSFVTNFSTAGSRSFTLDMSNGATATYAGDGVSGYDITSVQFELGSVATTYQPITTVDAEVIARFPTATLYQDTAGTQPVTTPGQSVGLMLDRSRGLALGPELIINGAFDGGTTGWTVTAPGANTITVSSGGVRFVANGSSDTAFLSQGWSGATAVGKTYRMTFDVLPGSTGTLKISTLGINSTVGEHVFPSTPGSKSFTLISSNVSTIGIARVVGQVADATIDNISVKELPGNHAVQATPANRPIYAIEPAGGRRNLLTGVTSNPVDTSGLTLFGDAAATLAVVSDAAAIAAAGLSASATSGTVFRLNNTAGTTPAYARFNAAITMGTDTWTLSAFVRGSGTTGLDVNAGTWSGSTSQALTAGYQRAASTGQTNTSSNSWRIRATAGTDLYFVLMQAEVGSTATAYQSALTQYNVTEANVPSMSYLSFNGLNFSMSTPSINFPAGPTNPALGPELVTNGNFSDGSTGWTVNTGWSITGGGAVGAATNASLLGGGVTPVAGRTYRVDFDVISYTSGTLFITVGGNFSGNPTLSLAAMAPGRKSVYVVSGSSPSRGVEFYGGSIAATIDNISVREIAAAYAPDKMSVFGGVRKLVDLTTQLTFQVIAETSVSSESNNGAFRLNGSVGFSTNRKYEYVQVGTLEGRAATTSASFAAPNTAVLSGLGNISGDLSTLRINGVQEAQSTADQGTGSFLAYPLFIGARNNASNFFSGHLYSLIVRGAQSTTTQITETEAWVAGETGFFVPVISGVPTVGIS